MSADLRKIARGRLREARALLGASEWSGAYYLSGYAVECALKARIASDFGRYAMPDLRLVKDSHTHHLPTLVKLADLDGALQAEQNTNAAFAVNWAVVKDWSEHSRYEFWSEAKARDLYAAISARKDGVFPWLAKRW